MRRVLARVAREANFHRPKFGFAPPPTSLQSSAYFIPQRWRRVLRDGENIGHANDEIEGEMEEGMISDLRWMGEDPPEASKQAEYKEGEWNPESQRTGVLGTKVGMMNVWDTRGVKTLVTVVKLDNCQVVQIRKEWTPQGEKFVNLQVASGSANVRTMKRSTVFHYRAHGIEPKKGAAEFRVSEDGILPVGTKLTSRHFVPGQFVDVTGTTKGKGFAGVMKKWGFKGQAASHGVSLTHRALGSIGQCQSPGKVWKGKKMPGRMGTKRRTHFNYQVYKIDVARDLIFLKGSIPGNNGSFVRMQDARRKKWNPNHPPPYPTFEPDENEERVDELVMDVSHLQNPFKLAVA